MKKNIILATLGVSILFSQGSYVRVLAEETLSPTTAESISATESSDIDIQSAASESVAETKLSEKTSITPPQQTGSVVFEREKNLLTKYLADNYIIKEQFDETLTKLLNATDDKDITLIMTNLETQIDSKALLYRWSFSESYINIEANIKTLLKNGVLSETQGQDFLTQLENCTSKEGLTALWNKVQPYTETTQETTITSSVPEKTSTTTIATTSNSSKVVSVDNDNSKKLPQTGELANKSSLTYIGVSFLLMLSVFSYIKFKTLS